MEEKPGKDVDLRKNPRVELQDSVGGEVQAIVASSIINLSASGALVELPCRLNPGGLYEIRMTFPDRTINAVARVIRSFVHALGESGADTSMLLYRAGLSFDRLEDDDSSYLKIFVEGRLTEAK